MLQIYQACCENVRELKKQAKTLNRSINNAIISNRHQEVYFLTRVYALLYSSYAEVAFLKLIHTPHGFSEDYIKQIQSQRALENKWEKCFELAFQSISSDLDLRNKELWMRRILNEYILSPSRIRNKIAHGQWAVCLNSESTAINNDITAELQNLDYVRIEILFNIYSIFSQCIEDLIESPHRAHYRYFYGPLTNLEDYINKTKSYTVTSKIAILKNSPKICGKHGK